MNDKLDPLNSDIDPQETREWKDALEEVIERDGPERAHFLIEALVEKARRTGAYLPYNATTAYINTIPPHREARRPGDPSLERRLKSIIRWNAMAMVVKANRKPGSLGGHIATYQSAANLFEIGFNHFFHAPTEEHGGDLVMFQGHSSPGIYARAFLEGRIEEEQMANFREETIGGLASYPHPWLMPGFWQFPTVSMGLTSLSAIYQARFMKYLDNRGLIDAGRRKVWAFLGDGEMDEPESLGAISLATREKLDNLVFVINCNLQRLDGPVRGNGKVIQELEAVFRGSGWNVLKVVWGSNWDPLLARDRHGFLRKRMEEVLDGEYQLYASNSEGDFVRKHFFGKYPELAEMVADMSDAELWRLKRGGHDPQKVYAAYHEAVHHVGQPTVILAKTVKGYGMGESGEGQNITHQQKKLGEDSLRQFRDRFNIPISDEQIEDLPFYKPEEDSAVMRYLRERRDKLGGYLPKRRIEAEPLEVPELAAFSALLEGSGDREMSTTMAFVRLLMTLTRDDNLKERLVPIIADEARTFGMEGMFRQIGIYAPEGQLYTPEDREQLAYYREEKSGQILQEGISEAGSLASWIAAGTSYSNHGLHMIPFFIFYSMFGFQRVGDLIWKAGDMRARGFLLGATSGRTTLNGEGLQHQDGHSHLLSSTVPNCVSYDPSFAYEVAVIMQDGLRRMYAENESVFYYVTLLNENYPHPPMPDGAEEGIRKGLYLLSAAKKSRAKKAPPRIQLLGSGAILREVQAAAELLEADFGVKGDVWSVPSFTELRRDGISVDRWNLRHPKAKARVSYVERCLGGRPGPVVAATDYMRSVADQIRAWVPGRYVTLGTDGFGRSDTRERLRAFFEVDRFNVVLAALRALADDGEIAKTKVADAIDKYDLDPDKAEPWTV